MFKDPLSMDPSHQIIRHSWGHQKGGLVNLRFIIFLNFPFLKVCLLVWDSGLKLIYGN